MGILDKLKAQQTERNLKKEDLDLRGSGIRARDFERAEKSYDREEKKYFEKAGETATLEVREKFQDAMEQILDAIERDARIKNIVLDPSQKKALAGVLKNQVCCLIGAAGTGKTTLERIIISHLAKQELAITVKYDPADDAQYQAEAERIAAEEKKSKKVPPIAVAAFTGRAAQQSRRAIGNEYGIPIRTMHSLLGYAPTEEYVDRWDPITKSVFKKAVIRFRPTYNASLKLPYKIYIIDEASMMPVPLWNEFIDAIHPESRIILVGDIHQLPPVYGKSVLGYALRKWPTFQLEKIHRQAEGNAIIANAHRVLNGQMIQKAENFHMFESKAGGATDFSVYIRQVATKLASIGAFDPFRDAIIVANSDPDIMTSAPALNLHFMTAFNPEKKVDGVIVNKRIKIHTGTGEVTYAVGDKIMNTQNNNNVNPPITNGMMGIVERININGKYDMKRAQVDFDDNADEHAEGFDGIDIDDIKMEFGRLTEGKEDKEAKPDETMDQRQASHVMTIRFETGQVFECSTSGDYRRMTLGYAITCHKSQGGEYPNIIIAIHSANGALLTQEWLYTAVTRARDNVYILFNKRGLQRATSVQKIKGKTLAEKITSYIIEAQSSAKNGGGSIEEMPMDGNPWNVDKTKFPILFKQKEMK